MTTPAPDPGHALADLIDWHCDDLDAGLAHEGINPFGQLERTYELTGATIVIRWPAPEGTQQ